MDRVNSNLCVYCDYDLRSHPTSGRCPECGLRYDSKTTILHWPAGIGAIRYFLPPCMAILGLSVVAIKLLSNIGLFVGAAILMIIPIVIWKMLQLPRQWFVATTPDGIVIRPPEVWKKRTLVSWNRVNESFSEKRRMLKDVSGLLLTLGVQLEQREHDKFRHEVIDRLYRLEIGREPQ